MSITLCVWTVDSAHNLGEVQLLLVSWHAKGAGDACVFGSAGIRSSAVAIYMYIHVHVAHKQSKIRCYMHVQVHTNKGCFTILLQMCCVKPAITYTLMIIFHQS